jgi:hypothetical protein
MTVRYEPKFARGETAWFLRNGLVPEWIRVEVLGAHGVFSEPSYVVNDGRLDHHAPLYTLRKLSAVERLGDLVR